MRTFVIGDVHGHHERLEALLIKAKLDTHDEVIQLGDMGHYSIETIERDRTTWELAERAGILPLWGNHDRALIDPQNHSFRGYSPPAYETLKTIHRMNPRFAVARHGYLLTHAGLHSNFVSASGMTSLTRVEVIAQMIEEHGQGYGIVDAVGWARGGISPAGGILWRDADREPLYTGVKQIFGHTSKPRVRRYNGDSYCIDVGDKFNGNLVGMWLDTNEIVAVGPDAAMLEELPSADE